MKKRFISICMLLLAGVIAAAQENDIWYSFEDNATELIGFKDMDGNVKIEPKFGFFTHAHKFDKIIAVSEPKSEGGFASYYLTKTGKKVGIESMYMFDMTYDCESEGYIRFKDQKIKKVGLFDGYGNAVIPPVYNRISQVHNGVMFALSGATLERDGEHFFFKGGIETLIDKDNNTLIKDFPFDENINLYSMLIEDGNHSISPIRDYFVGVNGKTYSFINYKKEFQYWLKSVIKKELDAKSMQKHFFKTVSYWQDPKGWILVPKEDIKEEIVADIIHRLKRTQIKDTTYFVSIDRINSLIFTSKEFESFFDNCHEAIVEKYPLMDVVVDGENNNEYVQDHFEFLRTDEGYKLISFTIRSE